MPACNGECYVQHPLWEEFWRLRGNQETENKPPVAKHSKEWFASVHGMTQLPDLEIICPTCNGRGHTGTEHQLDDVIANLHGLIEHQDLRITALEALIKRGVADG